MIWGDDIHLTFIYLCPVTFTFPFLSLQFPPHLSFVTIRWFYRSVCGAILLHLALVPRLRACCSHIHWRHFVTFIYVPCWSLTTTFCVVIYIYDLYTLRTRSTPRAITFPSSRTGGGHLIPRPWAAFVPFYRTTAFVVAATFSIPSHLRSLIPCLRFTDVIISRLTFVVICWVGRAWSDHFVSPFICCYVCTHFYICDSFVTFVPSFHYIVEGITFILASSDVTSLSHSFSFGIYYIPPLTFWPEIYSAFPHCCDLQAIVTVVPICYNHSGIIWWQVISHSTFTTLIWQFVAFPFLFCRNNIQAFPSLVGMGIMAISPHCICVDVPTLTSSICCCDVVIPIVCYLLSIHPIDGDGRGDL